MHQPHAVVLLPNTQTEARAQRNCLALAEAGYRVTLVGHGVDPFHVDEFCGIPHVLCPPLPPPGAAAAASKPSLTYRAVRKGFQVVFKRRPPQRVLQAVGRVDQVTGAVRRRARSALEALPGRGADTPSQPEPAQETFNWRTALPHVPRIVEAMRETVVTMRPDVLVVDVHLMPLAVQVRDELAGQGHHVGLVYDVREYVYGLASDDPNVTRGFPDLESEFMDQMDGFFTVCEPIAEFVRDHYGLDHDVPLVPNAPLRDLPPVDRPQTLRDFLNVPADAPILAYAGGLSYHRGIHDVVAALPELPGVHLALGARRGSSYTLELEQQAQRLGVADRVHFVPFAPGHEVAEYLESATAAVIPFLPVGNHVWAAPNKFFESVQAGLPILTSDMEWMAERVQRLGIGEVFRHSDPADAARAIRLVLDNLDQYRAAITPDVVAEHSFETYAHTVADVCQQVTAPRLLPGLRPTPMSELLTTLRPGQLRQRANLADAELFEPRPWLRIGTANSAGQGLMWAQSVMRHHPRVIAESVWQERPTHTRFPVDEVFTDSQAVYPRWQDIQIRKLEGRVTHVLSESGRTMVGARFGSSFADETAFLRKAGVSQAVVLHGSDIRSPRRHAELEPESPFTDPDDDLTRELQRRVDARLARLRAFDGPVFVTTHDLFDYLPEATWLPVVTDTAAFAPTHDPLSGVQPPVIFHAPSHEELKGSSAVDQVCAKLEAEGLVRYVRGQQMTRPQMRQAILEADIVVDQLRLGDYGVTATEAMAAGKVVVGHVAERVRQRLPRPVPIVEAVAATLEPVLRDLLGDPARAAALGGEAREYAVDLHDGRRAADVLVEKLGL